MPDFIKNCHVLSKAAARLAKDCHYFTAAIEQGDDAVNAREKLAKALATFLGDATTVPAEMISGLESHLNRKHSIDPTGQPPGPSSAAAEIEKAPNAVVPVGLSAVSMIQTRNHKSIVISDAARLSVDDILRITRGGYLEGIKRTPTGPPGLRGGYLVSFFSTAVAEAFMAWTATSGFRASIHPEFHSVKFEWTRREWNMDEELLRTAFMAGARCTIIILGFPAFLAADAFNMRIRHLFRTNVGLEVHHYNLDRPRSRFTMVVEHITAAMLLKLWFDKGLLGPEFQDSKMVYARDPNEMLQIPQTAKDPKVTTEAQTHGHNYERGGAAQNLPSNPTPRAGPARYRKYQPQHRAPVPHQPIPTVNTHAAPATEHPAQGTGSRPNRSTRGHQNAPYHPATQHYQPQHGPQRPRQPFPEVNARATGHPAQGAVTQDGSIYRHPNAPNRLVAPNKVQGNVPPPYSTMQGHTQAGPPVAYTHMSGPGKALGDGSQGVAQEMEWPTASPRQMTGQAIDPFSDQLLIQVERENEKNVGDKNNDKDGRKGGEKGGEKNDEKYDEKADEGKEDEDEEGNEQDLMVFDESDDENSGKHSWRFAYTEYAKRYEDLLY